MTLSNISRKWVGGRIHPCLTPFLTCIKSESFLSWEILHLNPSYNILIIWIILLGIPYSCSMSHIISLFTESNAFRNRLRSHIEWPAILYFVLELSLKCLLNQRNFGVCGIQLVLFGGVVPLYFVLFKIILARILLGILTRVIPLQLLQFDKSLFFGILRINHSSQPSGIFSSFHIFSSRGHSISAVISGSSFSTSGYTRILSKPTAFPFFNLLTVFQFL